MLMGQAKKDPSKLEEAEAVKAQVKANADRLAELEAQAEAARAERDRLEYKYRCESLINTELIDLCKREGVPFREALTRRPW